MADMYVDMAGVTASMTAPTSKGGLGQGRLVLAVDKPGEVDPDKPWVPVKPTRITEPWQGVVFGVASKLIGVEMGGTVIRASDLQATGKVPKMEIKAGDTLIVDGKPLKILDVEPIPAAGTASAYKFTLKSG